MAKETKKSMVEKDLKQLERRVDDLIRTVGRLTAENRSLQTRQDSMAGERARLIKKHELVRGRVESMINRLRSLEHAP
ncbi:MAG: TIGR02449 family protein [Gammaproteobacteria bacterium]